MVYHYVRVSTREQNEKRQLDALSEYKKADKVFIDKQSGKSMDRIQYKRMKKMLKSGDEVIVKEFDRLGRNKEAVKEELSWFKENGITLRILEIPTSLIDFNGQGWIQDMVTNILIEVMTSIAEQERMKIRARQAEGIASMPVIDGKRIGKSGNPTGRPVKDTDDFDNYLSLVSEKKLTVLEACQALGISKTTYYKRLKEEKQPDRFSNSVGCGK